MTGPRDVVLQEVRPSLRTYAATLRTPGQLLAFAVAGLSLALNLADWTAAPALVALVGGVSALALPLLLQRYVARVRVTDRAVHRRDALGRTRVVPRAEIAQALLLPAFRSSGGPATGLLVLLDGRRRPLLRVHGRWWGADRLRSIAEAVAAPVLVIEDPLTPLELVWRRVYELSWRERHPVLTDVLVALGAVVLLVGGVLVARGAGWT
ncbi:hypothetical protein [Geodermatophilus sp. DSM 44513]|uniref:hypothetical protein n=1 Tax=Geodermatophilus sp. DSM 44513 TaxID=1528104 RepID=UPI001412FD23|nr:hypothetical protein [Geodermatophilus sp. DSM 44513]WNV77237.1 hypothetical protein RTG05_08180 [Geodermatophilus sp. DSM 44513]